MAGECFNQDTAADFAHKDLNRIVGQVAVAKAKNSPYINLLKGGTIGNESDNIVSLVQEQAALGASLTKPEFVSDVSTCGTRGNQDSLGQRKYNYALETLRGRGERICVKTSRTAFLGSYEAAAQALKAGVVKITNADIRSTLLERSGVKFIMDSTKTFENMISGDQHEIDVAWPTGSPDAGVSFKALHRLMSFLREDLMVDPFAGDAEHFRLIAGFDSIESFRNELGVKEDLVALTGGSYTLGEKSIAGYRFQGPYRGVAFGIDPQPLRSNGFDEDGVLELIEPEIKVATDKGWASRRNPDWSNALWEVMFLVGGGSFKRLTPKSYTGEGSFKFNPQLYMGELQWHNIKDNDCNLWGDYGQHIYQLQRAYKPEMPHAVVPILFKRCSCDLGISTCVPCGSSSSSI